MRVLVLVLLVGCVEARSGAGAECSRNSECAAPLVCALERCRNECNSSRDCPIGASCIRSELDFGVCQLDDELSCSGECAGDLVCAESQCVNSCDEGCLPGSECRDGGCIESAVSCDVDAECSEGQVCLSGRCQRECISMRDCRFGRSCVDGRCVVASIDAGRDVEVPFDASLDAPATDTTPEMFCDASAVPAIDVAVGRDHACVVLSTGSVYCWGDNALGQIGSAALVVGVTDVWSAFPADVSDAQEVSAGVAHTCVRRADDTVECWGDNTDGGCGVGRTDRIVRVPESIGLPGVAQLALGSRASCARVGTTVSCWGRQVNNGLANGVTSGNAFAPVVATELMNVRTLAYAYAGGAALDVSGALRVWGDHHPVADTPAYVSPSFTDATMLAVGAEHICLLRSDGSVWCAGDNEFGQLGDPSRDTSSGPDLSWTRLPSLSDVVQVDASDNNTCARTSIGDLWCWGINTNGSLGVGMSGVVTEPTQVELPSAADDVSVGNDASCAIATGSVYCWGANLAGRLGFPQTFGSTNEPTIPVECLP